MADFILEEAKNQEQIQKQKAIEMMEKMREEVARQQKSQEEVARQQNSQEEGVSRGLLNDCLSFIMLSIRGCVGL